MKIRNLQVCPKHLVMRMLNLKKDRLQYIRYFSSSKLEKTCRIYCFSKMTLMMIKQHEFAIWWGGTLLDVSRVK